MSSLYEIIELTNGDIVLKRVDAEDESEPLVAIKFSEESLFFLGEAKLEIAKAMIEAGLDTVSEIVEPESLSEQHNEETSFDDLDDAQNKNAILH